MCTLQTSIFALLSIKVFGPWPKMVRYDRHAELWKLTIFETKFLIKILLLTVHFVGWLVPLGLIVTTIARSHIRRLKNALSPSYPLKQPWCLLLKLFHFDFHYFCYSNFIIWSLNQILNFWSLFCVSVFEYRRNLNAK